MRILALTDIHNKWSNVKKLLKKVRNENLDLIVVAGDLSFCGDLNEALNMLKVLSEKEHVLFVPGNCDSPSLLHLNKYGNAENIHGKIVDYKGFVFAGLGGSNPTPFNTPVEFLEYEIRNILLNVKNSLNGRILDVLVSHPPPYNTKLDIVRTGEHVGSLEVRFFIENVKPRLCICGHIHESPGLDSIGKTLILNPGPLAYGNYSIIELEKNSIEAEIFTV